MDRTEAVFLDLFSTLRDSLKEEAGIGLALKAEGQDVTLRIRSERHAGDEKRPFFAIVIGAAERDEAFRVTYNPSGTPCAERQVAIVDAASAEELLGLVRHYVEEERRRLVDYREEC
ncbi:hypothetical protein [Singulisphaera sp. PoT]|uniref:hypothetical protein n=1 Tax=Singulisphaera sp. PoT TaxID=3411797 RepID=UPI003BF59A16